MQRIITLTLCLMLGWSLSAQDMRFIDEIYDVGEIQYNQPYGQNISVLTGSPEVIDLEMDIYQPSGEGAEDVLRPVVCIFHSGNFLPQYINRGPYGGRLDSINVEMAKRLVKRGFVAASVTYRTGWLPTAVDQVERTGSLLRAAYRGGQDAHTLARYLRMTVDSLDNPYLIDTSRIVFMGIGTGGYVVSTHAFLDRNDEIGTNIQFYNEQGDTLIQADTLGNPQATRPALLSLTNHVGYSSDVAMTINVGGATGDGSWIEGKDHEPLYMGFHSFTDPFAPFYEGLVGVPVGGGNFLPVIEGARGTNGTLELVELNGGQPELDEAGSVALPAMFPPLSSILNVINNQYKMQTVVSPIPNDVDDPFQLSRDNMFPQVYPRIIAGPYNWFDEATMRSFVAAINQQTGAGLDPDVIIAGEEQSNPNWNDPAEAKKTIDTMIAYMLPRLWYGMDLNSPISSTEELLNAQSIGLDIFPNPASSYIRIRTEEGFPIRDIRLIDQMGRVVTTWTNINQADFRINRGDWPRGMYSLLLRLDEGVVSQQLLFE